jgi:hypothetical protein
VIANTTLDALLWMLIAHALCDYPLQGDWLSKAKNPSLTLVSGEEIWSLALMSHAAIHAGAVKLITGSWVLASFEFFAHVWTDYAKCRGYIKYNADQCIHLGCKACWAAFMFMGVI